MDIRNISTDIGIELTGIEVMKLLEQEAIRRKFEEVMNEQEVISAKKEVINTLKYFSKILMAEFNFDNDDFEQVLTFNIMATAVAWSLKALVFSDISRKVIIAEMISPNLAYYVMENIKDAYITEWSNNMPMRKPQAVTEAVLFDIYS